jgi:aflatoxin B1 aldehyde reductase
MGNEVKLVLGTMTFGPQVNLEVAESMVEKFLDNGYCEIDTAYVYNEGSSERILGESLKHIKNNNYKIATKVNPRISGKLDSESINAQFTESLRRLSLDSVETLYLHFPDPSTPLEVTLGTIAKLHEEGKFREFGLSNFPAWMVVDIWHICKENGWPLPVVYQGVYNGLSRKAEEELLPALKRLGIRFYAYNPLAGGILAGKYHSYNEEPTPGRFTHRPNYKDRYWKETFFNEISKITELCEQENIKIIEAAYRWLAYHSQLDGEKGDGILIGASRLEQLDENLSIFSKGILPENIVRAFDQAWKETESDSPEYFRLARKK